MSNQEMANRIYDILSTKAALGMGRDSEGILERYGRGVTAGRGTKQGAKNNPWINCVKQYAKAKGITYKEALKSKGISSYYEKYKKSGKMKTTTKKSSKPVKRSTSKAPKNKAKKKCPKGTVAIPIRRYTRSDGTKIKSYEKCIKNIMKKY